MTLIDGKKVADCIKEEIGATVEKMVAEGKKRPHLAAILVGHDGGSETYVAHKVRACEQCGFKSTLIRFEDDVTEEKLLEAIDSLNRDVDVDGFIVQLPLPRHISEQKIIEAIDYRKDVDGFHPINVGRMSIGLPCYLSATPAGIMELIARYDIPTKGKRCVVLGRSNIVGKTVGIYLGGQYYDFTVVGVAKSGITGLQSMMAGIIPDFAYVPFTTMQDITGKNTFDKIALLLNKDSADKNLTLTLKEEINGLKNTENAIAINNFQSQKGQLQDILGIISAALSLIAGISLLVSGITVMTTMLVSVGERTREIGIKKSIGARDRDIMEEFLLESVLLTALGSIGGIILGVLVCWIGCLILGVELIVPVTAIAAAFFFSVFMGAAFGVYPAAKAAGLRPIEALRR